MTDVFISYKSQRHEHARRFSLILEAAGYDVWWAPSRIKPGRSFDDQLDEGLEAAKAVIVLWCSGSCDSRYVKHEANHGIDNGKLIQCIIEKQCKPPSAMRHEQYEDMSDWNGSIRDPRLERVLAAVEEKVKRPRRSTPDLIEALSSLLPALPSVLPLPKADEPCGDSAPATDLDAATFEKLTSADEFEAYTLKYPSGAFVKEAQQQIEKRDAAWLAQLNITEDDWRLSTRRQIVDKIGQTASRADLEPRANRGSAVAATLLGLQLEDAGDTARASELYGRAATQGFARAQILYADTLATKDPVECMRWARASADQGNPWGINLVGVNYQKGCGVEKDNAQAAAWYIKSAEQGLSISKGNLGFLLRRGLVGARDYAKALEWYRQGAAEGDVESQYGLAMMLINGEGVAPEAKAAALQEALDWLSKAAEAGDARSEECLADMREQGSGVERDAKAAFDVRYKAAQRGVAEARFQVGRMYEHGIGVEKDLKQALEWYEKAELQGHAEAAKAVARLA